MREFTFDDGFLLSEMLDKMGISDDLNGLMDAARKAKKEGKDSAAFVGGQIILSVIKKLHLAKNEVVKFVSGMTGDTEEEVKKYKIPQIKSAFVEIFKQSGIQDFFK